MTEFELIYRYFKQDENTPTSPNSAQIIKSLGDDAAVIEFSGDSQWVTCVDTLVQGRHFSKDWAQVNQLAFAIGYKAVVVNLSDLAAMGATAHSILLALSLPERLVNESWLGEFAKGLKHACQQFSVELIGGDTTRHEQLIISITANGLVQNGTRPVYRSGANIGDKVYVTGTLGDAGYALKHPDTTAGQQLAHRLHMPTPRLQLGQTLASQNIATAMIDISDGLIQDLGHICQQSDVGMCIKLENLPSSEALQTVNLTERLLSQLTGGDDYELAFSVSPNSQSSKNLENIIHSTHVANSLKVTCIGEVVDYKDMDSNTPRIILTYQGKQVTQVQPYPFKCIPRLAGFQHFS